MTEVLKRIEGSFDSIRPGIKESLVTRISRLIKQATTVDKEFQLDSSSTGKLTLVHPLLISSSATLHFDSYVYRSPSVPLSFSLDRKVKIRERFELLRSLHYGKQYLGPRNRPRPSNWTCFFLPFQMNLQVKVIFCSC